MDALQADSSAVPEDSVGHFANALVNMQVTAPAAATLPASTLVYLADTSAAAVRARDSTAQDTKMLDALESILHRLEALESPSRSPHSPPSPPSGSSSCSSPSIAIEVPVVSSSASRRRYKI
jgi:hypothetical protein